MKLFNWLVTYADGDSRVLMAIDFEQCRFMAQLLKREVIKSILKL